jgi:hypothetical protein
MDHKNAWIFNGSQGAGSTLIPKGGQFWLHAVNVDGSPAYFTNGLVVRWIPSRCAVPLRFRFRAAV